MWPFRKKEKLIPSNLTIREALDQLHRIGIKVRPDITTDDLVFTFGDFDSATDPLTVLCVLGGELERRPFNLLSENIWHLDAECIVENGDYVRLAERFALLSKSALPLENITDYIDLDEGVAWVEFSLAGKTIHWDLQVDNDWMDPEFYAKLQALVRNHDPKKAFFIAGLGQDSLISYGDAAMKDALSSFAGVKFSWE